MRLLRRAHLYLGCFFAPLLLFYILTGWYQTVNPQRAKHPSEAETLLQKLRFVHVEQIYPKEGEFKQPSPKLFQALVIAMAILATLAIVLGVVLAFKSARAQWHVWLAIVMGVVLPILLLLLGQKK